jgi:hypothetical protein
MIVFGPERHHRIKKGDASEVRKYLIRRMEQLAIES